MKKLEEYNPNVTDWMGVAWVITGAVAMVSSMFLLVIKESPILSLIGFGILMGSFLISVLYRILSILERRAIADGLGVDPSNMLDYRANPSNTYDPQASEK